MDDYEDIFNAAKKTLARFGLYTTYQRVQPSASKRAARANQAAPTPVVSVCTCLRAFKRACVLA